MRGLYSPLMLPLASGTDIRLRNVVTTSEAAFRPRPRGTGKLLTSIDGVGLALLRLEHVFAAETGHSQFYIDGPASSSSEDSSLCITTWRPDWWPDVRLVTE